MHIGIEDTIIYSMKELYFEWDDQKEIINIKKHGIDFSTAARVFNDENRLELYDVDHSENEDRYRVIGSIGKHLAVITVSYTPRENEKVIRLISARLSTKEERSAYYGFG